jgi:hypothetical protein
MTKSITQFHTLTLKLKTIICNGLCFKIIYCEIFSQTSGTGSPTDTYKPITNNPRWCQTTEVTWNVIENLLHIQQFEGLFSAVCLQVSAKCWECLMSTYIWNGFDDELVLLTAVSHSDMAKMNLSDDFIQLVPY